MREEDEIVKETRRLRDEYAKKFDYDLDLMVEDLQKKQKQREQKYIALSAEKETAGKVEKAA